MKQKWIFFVLRTIALFIIFNFFWGLIPIDKISEPMKTIINQYFSPVALLAIFLSISLVFLWNIPFFEIFIKLLLPVHPKLYGTWKGNIGFYAGEGEILKESFLVIYQPDAMTISVRLLTDERSSNSIFAAYEKGNDIGKLIYTYQTEDAVQNKEKNSSHIGSAILTLSTLKKHMTLTGDYFTSRKTVGRMDFHFCSRKQAGTYEMAQEICNSL